MPTLAQLVLHPYSSSTTTISQNSPNNHHHVLQIKKFQANIVDNFGYENRGTILVVLIAC